MNGSYHDRQVQIAEVLVRHRWDQLLEFLGLEGLVAFERMLGGGSGRSPAKDLRLALEELGPTFVKLGQFLSTRADLLPPDYQAELSRLQDHAPDVPSDVIDDIVSRELRSRTNKTFATFDRLPLACASIGQAHAATLHDGTEVVVKVRRPGVVEQVNQDLEIIHNLAVRVSQRWDEAARWDIVGLAEELGRTLRAEVDYLQEAQRAAIRCQLRPRPGCADSSCLPRSDDLPRPHARAPQGNEDHRRRGARRGRRRSARPRRADDAYRGQVRLRRWLLPRRPHPGNFFIQASGRIGIIDFGRVGRPPEGQRPRQRPQQDRPDRPPRADVGMPGGYSEAASRVLTILEETWQAIRARHPEIPPVVIIIASGSAGRDSGWGGFDPQRWTIHTTGTLTSRMADADP